MTKLSLVVIFSIIGLSAAKMQNITVTGLFKCNGKEMENIIVELWDKDTFDPDDLFATTQINSKGEFTVKGGESEIGSIEPYINVLHECNTSAGKIILIR
ncbi:hypothetical protein PFISCL1PPCAC_26366 [Pristionchus fissidentatus]|uniref:Transthyretin-like family protein n=1 Tax=Pristionchus fissidentatus TaxID=1538716 RepID=A0AAV5WWP0_9BILA|nr:hypothetical protein PFISCL1PPCAC_26366 [Pristionchus fissidentatus]